MRPYVSQGLFINAKERGTRFYPYVNMHTHKRSSGSCRSYVQRQMRFRPKTKWDRLTDEEIELNSAEDSFDSSKIPRLWIFGRWMEKLVKRNERGNWYN